MSNWNARISRNSDCASDTRHDFKWQIVFAQKNSLFAAAPEYKRVAALQTHDDFIFTRLLDEQLINFRLFKGMIARFLADVNFFSIRAEI